MSLESERIISGQDIMNEPTVDPYIVIIDRGVTDANEPYVTYKKTDEPPYAEWTVIGLCCCCGVCEVGAVNPYLVWQGEVGTPFACIDSRHPDRLDCPVTPAFFGDKLPPSCTLRLQE